MEFLMASVDFHPRRFVLLSLTTLLAAFLILSPGSVVASTSLSVSGGGTLVPNTVTHSKSTTFAGFGASITKISQVTSLKASWVQPTETCALGTTNAQAGFFTEISTSTGSDYVMAGTEGQCANPSGTTTTIYEAFFQFSNWCIASTCGRAYYVNSWSPAPGDHISVTITITSSNIKVTIDDVTKGKTFAQSCSTPPSGTSTNAACGSGLFGTGAGDLFWGTETWYDCNPTCVTQLIANFGTVSFGKDSTGVSGTNGATIASSTKTIATASSADTSYNMVALSSSSTTVVSTSSLSKDGTSFSTTWKNAGP